MVTSVTARAAEHEARQRKVVALADAINTLDTLPDRAELADLIAADALPPKFWTSLAALAGVRPPSAVTRQVLADLLRTTPTRPADPFDGIA